MRRKALVLMTAFLVVIGFVMAQQPYSTDNYRFFARISHIEGHVFIERAGETGIEDATLNMPVGEGDRIFTGEDGLAEIYVGYSTYIRLNQRTKLDITVLPFERSKRLELSLVYGDIFVRTFRDRLKINIEARGGEFIPMDKGVYRITYDRGEIKFAVEKGYAELRVGEEDIDIGSGEIVIVTRDRIFGPDRLKGFRDDFYYWNRDRDRKIERGYRHSRYLPPELSDYGWELEMYGTWRYVPPYGWVWVPRRIYDDWRPYYYGRWVWFPEGWFWVGYEPWGWAVYHYGRWGWSASIGWYWIPVPRWGYAWVNWTWFDGYIGWCPIDFYGRPIIIINGVVYHYYNYVPLYSSSWVFVRKDQFIASNIRRAALRKSQLRAVGVSKVRVFSTPPRLKPVYAVKKTRMGYKRVVSGVVPVTAGSATGAVRKGTVYRRSGVKTHGTSSGGTSYGTSSSSRGAVSRKALTRRKASGSSSSGYSSSSSSSAKKKTAKKKKKETYGYINSYRSTGRSYYSGSKRNYGYSTYGSSTRYGSTRYKTPYYRNSTGNKYYSSRKTYSRNYYSHGSGKSNTYYSRKYYDTYGSRRYRTYSSSKNYGSYYSSKKRGGIKGVWNSIVNSFKGTSSRSYRGYSRSSRSWGGYSSSGSSYSRPSRSYSSHSYSSSSRSYSGHSYSSSSSSASARKKH